MKRDTLLLRERIAAIVRLSYGEREDIARDIAFHLTDWDHNLEEISRMYNQFPEMSDDEILRIIVKFLAHVPNHLAAAKKLMGLGPIEDIFGAGVLQEDEEDV